MSGLPLSITQPNPSSSPDPSAPTKPAPTTTPKSSPTPQKSMADQKLLKLEVATTLTGNNDWKGFKGTITRWAKANGVDKHLLEDVSKRGIPSDKDQKEEWEQMDMKIFVAIKAKLSANIQATISSAEDAAEMWGRLVSTY